MTIAGARTHPLLGLAAVVALASLSAAQPTESVWEASSGLFPQEVCPAWTLVDTVSSADPVFVGGALVLTSPVANQDMFYVQTDLTVPAPDPLVIEARMRFESGTSNAQNRGPAAIAVTTAADTGTLFFIGTDEIFLTADGDVRGQTASVDTDGAAHTYRIEITAAGAVTVRYDGAATLTGATYSSAPAFGGVRRILWGEGSVAAFGTHAWESFRHNAAVCGGGTTTSTTGVSTTTGVPTTTVAPATTTTSGTLPASTSSTTTVKPTTTSSPVPTTSPTTTPRPTTTSTTLSPTVCDDAEPGSLVALLCRLDLLATRIATEPGLGKFRTKLAATLARAIPLASEADDACGARDTKTASRRMKQVQKLLEKMSHRLRGLSARKQLDAVLRAELIKTIEDIRANATALRKHPCD